MRGARNRPEDFWRRVTRSELCREWQGPRDRKGYGLTTWRGRSAHTHRLAWELTYGPVPPGMCVLHRCDNPPCCEPTHLFLGTRADNAADAMTKGRHTRGEMVGTAKLTTAKVFAVRSFVRAGYPQMEVANLFGCNTSTISRIARQESWKHVASGDPLRGARRGSRQWMAKLTEDQVRAIRHLLAAGEMQTAVAELYGVSRQNVGDIARGRRWAHLDAIGHAASASSRTSQL
jgi:predicted XRE-type DNA-binding protein